MGEASSTESLGHNEWRNGGGAAGPPSALKEPQKKSRWPDGPVRCPYLAAPTTGGGGRGSLGFPTATISQG